MDKLAFYGVTFGLPILLYALWLARFQKQCPFLGLLIIAVVAVWITLWPICFGPEHLRASTELNDRADTVVVGFIVMGWFYGMIGCLPILLVQIPRSILHLMRSRRTGSATSTKKVEASPSDDKLQSD